MLVLSILFSIALISTCYYGVKNRFKESAISLFAAALFLLAQAVLLGGQ
jgi:hypothetical protein